MLELALLDIAKVDFILIAVLWSIDPGAMVCGGDVVLSPAKISGLFHYYHE